MKLRKSVGKGGAYQQGDVALVQAALKASGHYRGRIDGRFTPALAGSILKFVQVNSVQEAQIRPAGPALQSLTASLPATHRRIQAWKQTPLLFVPAGEVKQGAWQRASQSVPDAEYESLRRALWQVDFVRQLGLVVADTSVTSDGRFLVKLAFPNVQFIDPASGALTRQIPPQFSVATSPGHTDQGLAGRHRAGPDFPH